MRWLAALACCLAVLSSCTEHQRARGLGGSSTVRLPPGQKLVNVTWKTDDLWILMRHMHPGEAPEEYAFKESSSWGMLEGVVIIQEQAKP